MKKKQTKMILMLVLLVALVGGYLGVRRYNEMKAAADEAALLEVKSNPYIVELEMDSIYRITYTLDGKTYTLVKEDGIWKDESDKTLSLNQSQAKLMESAGERMVYNEKFEDVEDLSAFGLDKPNLIVTYETTDGSCTVYAGVQNTFSGYYYMGLPDSNDVYTVTANKVTVFKAPKDIAE